MKRLLSLFSLLFLLMLPSVFAQTISDYITATKGDTLVVKDETDYGAPDALTLLLGADTNNVPAGRVYQLHKYGYYSIGSTNPQSSSKVKVIVAGDNNALIKNSQAADIPILTGENFEGSTSKGGIASGLDLLVKNINCNSGNSTANQGDWTFFSINPVGGRITVDNCLIEHNIWCEISPPSLGRVFFKNDYFVNLSGFTCRRNGGVIDFNGTATTLDTMWVENCTHVMTQGSLYKFRSGYSFNKVLFNHNDFVNCVGYVFMNIGTVSNISVTNNIFVNSNLQGYSPVLTNNDAKEVDSYKAPMGLVNVAPDSALFKAATGGSAHFYVDKNLVYWDPKLTAVIPSALNTAKVNGVETWVSQMIKMNTRTKTAFDDNDTYPYLVEGTWYEQLPTFANTATLFTDQLTSIIDYIKVCSDTTYSGALPYWREVYPSATNFSYSDWPIPIKLSYTDATLLKGGINEYPLGDLNWFPTQYASWTAQKAAEYTKIQTVLNTGKIDAVKKLDGLPTSYSLSQNYPNPFNPTTNIKYSITKESQVSLKVFDMIGREVETLVNVNQKAGSYEVNFNASKLASGIYIYRLQAGNFTQSMKMMLIK